MCFSLPLMRASVFYYWRISFFRSAVLAQSTRCLCCPLRAVEKKKVYCRRLHARTGKESFWHFSPLQLCSFFFSLFSLFFFFGLLFDESVSSGKEKNNNNNSTFFFVFHV